MENSLTSDNIANVIINTINTILENLFSSIDNTLYSVLDDITFISPDILETSYFHKILGMSASNGILIIANSLVFGFLIYFSIKYLLSHFYSIELESPHQFVFKLLFFGLLMNSSYFIIEQILNLSSNITLSIRNLGENIFNK